MVRARIQQGGQVGTTAEMTSIDEHSRGNQTRIILNRRKTSKRDAAASSKGDSFIHAFVAKSLHNELLCLDGLAASKTGMAACNTRTDAGKCCGAALAYLPVRCPAFVPGAHQTNECG